MTRCHRQQRLVPLLVVAISLPASAGLAQGRPPASRPAATTSPASAPAPSPRPTGDAAARLSDLEKALEQMRATQQAQERRIKELEQKNEAQSTQILQMQAESEAGTAGETAAQAEQEKNLAKQSFKSGERALQAFNPELSVVGDLFGKVILDGKGYRSEDDRSGVVFRALSLHFQSTLDPFSLMKAAVVISPEGVDLEEAYATWTGVFRGLSVMVGRFRQEFGVVNRWHDESLDQVDYPLALTEILGEEGLTGTGLSLQYLVPKFWAATNHIVLQVTNGENDQLFAGEFFSIPSVLLRLKNYFDLSESTYFELGLTGMVGWNNARGKPDDQGQLVDEPWRTTWTWGADWTLSWAPLRLAKYRGLVTRGELYGARKELPEGKVATAFALYQYIEGRLSESWLAGVRFDWAMPLQADNDHTFLWDAVPYVTWWQSEYVRARLQYAWTRSDLVAQDDHRVLLQVTFAAGPHKHERY